MATSMEHAQQAIEGRLVALGRAHDLLMQVSWANTDASGKFDVLVSRDDQPSPPILARAPDADFSRLASDPLRRRRVAALTTELSQWLKTNLRDAPAVARVVAVDQLPAAAS